MGWFKSRQRNKNPSSGQIEEGYHRSPGLEVICHFLETEPAYTVLDLGPSSTENLEFLSELCEDLVVEDVFHSAEKKQGIRSEIFQFERAKDASLPDLDQPFDVVLLWDLLHYFPQEERKELAARLARRCSPQAMVLIMASALADIPPVPIQFKIKRRDRLEYILGDERAPAPGLTTREVEKLMVGFKPVRIFQLRNGIQEMVFQLADPPTRSGAVPPTAGEPAPAVSLAGPSGMEEPPEGTGEPPAIEEPPVEEQLPLDEPPIDEPPMEAQEPPSAEEFLVEAERSEDPDEGFAEALDFAEDLDEDFDDDPPGERPFGDYPLLDVIAARAPSPTDPDDPEDPATEPGDEEPPKKKRKIRRTRRSSRRSK